MKSRRRIRIAIGPSRAGGYGRQQYHVLDHVICGYLTLGMAALAIMTRPISVPRLGLLHLSHPTLAVRGAVQNADHRHRRLLRARYKRPRSRAAKQRGEFAPSHSITSSAIESRL